MHKSEFLIAGFFSLMLGTGILVALGASAERFMPLANEGLPANPVSNFAQQATAPSPASAPPTEAALEVQLLATERQLRAPKIEILYGRTQNFGLLGNPQPLINVLGNVAAPHGVVSLTYSLNGGPEKPLCVQNAGFENCNLIPRLVSDGDFNIDISVEELNVGQNGVLVTATDSLGNQMTEVVTVQYSGANTWPLPYFVDWSAATRISDVAQIVDGLWELESTGIRPIETGYDRIVAIGDVQWTDYEVLVPVLVHRFLKPDDGAVGIVVRWQGHFIRENEQPGYGWWNFGAYAHLQNRDANNGGPYMGLQTGRNNLERSYDSDLDIGVPFYLKLRVQSSSPNQIGFYSFKAWEVGQPEPSEWLIEKQDEPPEQPLNGSVLLLAHHADATFGEVTITPLGESENSPPEPSVDA